MVQAARSGVQNIAEGSQASGTSKKTELKLTNVARASLEELRLDYEDFLRQRRLKLWEKEDKRRKDLINRRCKNADAVAEWVREIHEREKCDRNGQKRLNRQDEPNSKGRYSGKSKESIRSIQSGYAEIAANAAITLIIVACSLLNRQILAQAEAFENEGGFTERLYQRRQTRRRGK